MPSLCVEPLNGGHRVTRMIPARLHAITFISALFALCLSVSAQAQTTREIAALQEAMTAVRSGNWDTALEKGNLAGPIGRDIIEWHRLRAGKGRFDDVTAFLDRRADWPGLPYLRRRSEGTVPYRARPDDVIAFFDERAPQTGAGMIVLAAAHETRGDKAAAEPLIIRAWTEFDLTTGDETYLMERYRSLLKPHHEARLDRLLWTGREKAAERMLPRVSKGWQALARARIALRENKAGVDALIEAVPEELRNHPGLAFERFQWRAQKGRNEAAIELALERPGTVEALGKPGRWANWRRVFARWAMRQGDGDTAYRLAAAHGLESGSAYADLEWLSGYLALRYLDDPQLALGHFRQFRIAVSSPISLGRAGYWEGRAHEALGDAENAAMAYAFGAEHQTSFYGLLAAERAGLPMDPALTGTTVYPPWSSAAFVSSSVLEAAQLLQKAGERSLAERFLVHLAESLSPVELGQLADYALSLEEPHIALMIAKQAARMQVVIPHAYFPVVDFGLEDLPVPEELALAIARRESEFDPAVRSGAGAVGLMQVMPRTARAVADALDVSFSTNKLQSDPVYNARIGVHYLAELVDIFGDNMVLVSAAYNAGPSRPIRWIDEQGDPRDASVDAVDWIEHIQFRETRNYVMRVMESLPIYRARLSGETAPIQLSRELVVE
ncbi:MAG: lytic transglycosylase domain-containing protein [Rhodobacteraceae bacterium]|nr:lytic transglycosylase domain-containing protein [Paracoccaceae bacterium]